MGNGDKIYIGTGRCNRKAWMKKYLDNHPCRGGWTRPNDAVDAMTMYCYNDWKSVNDLWPRINNSVNHPYGYFKIKKVIFDGPATIVLWKDGSKTVVKCRGEEYDPEKGLAMAIAKHFLGTNESKYNYYDVFKKWLPKEVTDLPMIPKPQENIGETVGRILRENALKGMAFKFNTEESDENGAEDNN